MKLDLSPAVVATVHVVTGIAALVVLMALHVAPFDVGFPILTALFGVGTGAGVALITPGNNGVPSAGQAQAPSPASATPATSTGLPPVQMVEASQSTSVLPGITG